MTVESNSQPHRFDLSWNDLRDLLCLVETGSLSAAARASGVSQSTMSRRINAVEARGLTLFESGHVRNPVLTPLGRDLVEAARAMRAGYQKAEAAIQVAPAAIRIAACELTSRVFMSDAVSDWTRHSGQPVALGVYDDLFVLTPADFDVMVTPLSDPPPDGSGVRIGRIDWAPYASPLYLRDHPLDPETSSLQGHGVIRASGSLARTDAYLRWSAAGGTTTLMASSPAAQQEACARGQGIALLPRILADADTRLVRLDLIRVPPSDVWISAGGSNADNPRIANFLRWSKKHFGAAADIGRRP